MNRYLDIYEAIEEGSSYLEESEEFKKTDFPNPTTLPKQNLISESKKNEIRDWLLKVTVNKTNEFRLKTRQCRQCH